MNITTCVSVCQVPNIKNLKQFQKFEKISNDNVLNGVLIRECESAVNMRERTKCCTFIQTP